MGGRVVELGGVWVRLEGDGRPCGSWSDSRKERVDW